CEHEHLAAVDRAPTGHDAVGERSVGLDAEAVRAVPGEHVELDERARVEQLLQPLTREQLAPFVLALDRAGTAGLERLLTQFLELVETLFDGMSDGRYRLGRAAFALDVRVFDGHARLLLAPSQARALRRRSAKPPSSMHDSWRPRKLGLCDDGRQSRRRRERSGAATMEPRPRPQASPRLPRTFPRRSGSTRTRPG